MLTDEELKKFYLDEKFYGSFSGARNFQTFLKTDLNEEVPLERIYRVLRTIPAYVTSLKPIRRFPRRKYDVAGFGSLMQSDIAYMFEKNGYKYILVVCDIFSRHLWAEALKDKTAASVRKVLTGIFDSIPTSIEKFETDQGTEFSGLGKFFRERKILFKFKYQQHKANFAEHFVYLIKKKLYTILRAKVTDNWVKYLPSVVGALNHKPIKALGYRSPAEINSSWDDVKVRKSQKEENLEVYHEPNWQDQNKNQSKYLASKTPLKPGKF